MIKRHDAFQEVISQAQSNDFYGPDGTRYIIPNDLKYQGVYYICLNGITDSFPGTSEGDLSLASPTNLSDDTCSIGNGDGSCEYVFTTLSARFCPCAESLPVPPPSSKGAKTKAKKISRRKLRQSL